MLISFMRRNNAIFLDECKPEKRPLTSHLLLINNFAGVVKIIFPLIVNICLNFFPAYCCCKWSPRAWL